MTGRYPLSYCRQAARTDGASPHSRRANRARVGVPRGRGRRECRVIRLTRSLACKTRKHTSKSTTGWPNNPAFPARRFYDLFRALPGDRAFLPPSPRNAQHCRDLISASRYQNHTASSSRAGAFVCCADPRPSHPAPTFVTIAKRPSCRARDGRKGARDLPDVTTETACDTLARRANRSACAKCCQAPNASALAGMSAPTRTNREKSGVRPNRRCPRPNSRWFRARDRRARCPCS